MASKQGKERASSSILMRGTSSLKKPSPSASSSSKRGQISPTFNLKNEMPRLASTPRKAGISEARTDISKLPLDILCRCFIKLESIFHIVNCAAVCRAWRDASLLDVMWKEIYLQWHLHDFDISQPSLGCNSWREAFIKDFSKGRRRLLERTVANALERGLLQGTSYDFTPGTSVLALVEELHLDYYMRVNNTQQLRLNGKQAALFPASGILHSPFKLIKPGLKLSSLVSVEVIVSSAKLSLSCTVAHFTTGKQTDWKLNGNSAAPLRLVQHNESETMKLVVGTLLESEENPLREEILFIKVAMHLTEVISKLMKVGNAMHRVRQNPDPHYGLHGYHVSVQLFTFEKLIWTREFHEAFWNERESIPGQAAVLVLLSSFDVVPSKLSLPWRSQAFSGEIEHSLAAAITLWDANSEAVWKVVDIFYLKPVSVPTVEYGLPDFEGSQVEASMTDINKGISASIKCSVPDYSCLEAVFAITDLRLSLSVKFLLSWFGVSNI